MARAPIGPHYVHKINGCLDSGRSFFEPFKVELNGYRFVVNGFKGGDQFW
jgi:hypothetical protein